ncbi:MAG TPA: hypothetical protein VHY08_16720, partial [Bacillota bacterium]|nr:hypothetical protein [Bacillota bacterium]
SFPGDIRKQAVAASLSDGVDELHSGAVRSKDFQGLLRSKSTVDLNRERLAAKFTVFLHCFWIL